MRVRRRILGAAPFIAIGLIISGCAAGSERPTLPPAPSNPNTSATPNTGSTPNTSSGTALQDGPVGPVGTPRTIATGLDAPWSIAFTTDGSALISERDTGLVIERTADGELREIGAVDGVVPGGEGGLLGLALLPDGATNWLYAYVTATDDNRIVRMPLSGVAGSYGLGEAEVILDGLAKASNHNGGRIAFGPDGMLYATVGDAGDPERAPDVESLNGKILRMTPDGGVPTDNPFEASVVYSLGHRNPQGIAWDADGQLWAAEFGQNTWDEFNRIEPGSNYGWPVVEGIADDPQPEFVDPVLQWATSESSPSGLAFASDTFFLAALRGERVWAIYPDDPSPELATASATAWFQGEYGRVRDVQIAPDGMLWVLTSNTDGRGGPTADDDRIIEVQLAPLVEG